MKTIIAKLNDTRNEYTREYEYKVKNEYVESQEFWWTEGNAACDCNRILYLYNWDESKDLDCNMGDNIIELLSLIIDGNEVLTHPS